MPGVAAIAADRPSGVSGGAAYSTLISQCQTRPHVRLTMSQFSLSISGMKSSAQVDDTVMFSLSPERSGELVAPVAMEASAVVALHRVSFSALWADSIAAIVELSSAWHRMPYHTTAGTQTR